MSRRYEQFLYAVPVAALLCAYLALRSLPALSFPRVGLSLAFALGSIWAYAACVFWAAPPRRRPRVRRKLGEGWL